MLLSPRTIAGVTLLGCAWAAAPGVAARSPMEARIDCDAGDDLARAVRSLDARPPGPLIVEVAGTCRGPVEISRDRLTLRGASGGTAAIEGAAGESGAPPRPILTLRGARGVVLESLRISDGPVGIRAIGAEATLEACDLLRTDTAVEAHASSMTLVRTRLLDSRNGIVARRSRVGLSFSAIGDVSDEGIVATEFSRLALFRTEVVSDGLSVDSSRLVATHCEMRGPIHARAYARISLAGSDGPTAMLRGDISASNSEVFLFRLPVEGTIRVEESGRLTALDAGLVEVRLADASDARLASTGIAGDLVAEGFSTVQLTSAFVSGNLECRRGADAICERSAAGSVSGCASCEDPGGP